MKTVADLKNYLEKNNLSPEEISPRVRISNMTLRRLLHKAPQTRIPEKYRLQLDQLAYPNLDNVSDMVDYLNHTGEAIHGKKIDQVKIDLDEKLKTAPVDSSFKDKIKMLGHEAFSSSNRKIQAIAVGALLYFINPFDLIPDFTPLGYVDDIGVVTIAISAIVKIKADEGKGTDQKIVSES